MSAMADLLTAAELPEGFQYPRNLGRAIDVGLTDLDIWWIIEGDTLRNLFATLRRMYPARKLIPFARRQDNDDVACFDLDSGSISIIHAYASPGWEQRGEGSVFATFDDWLRQAIEDFIAFD